MKVIIYTIGFRLVCTGLL